MPDRRNPQNLFYKQLIEVNDAKGVVLARWFDMPGASSNLNSPVLAWEVYIVCGTDKSAESFSFTFRTKSKSDSIKLAESKNLTIPDRFKEVITTFKCK